MIREFKLPDVGEGLTEAEIVAWHVEPGDTVSEDQVVAEVETDKAVVEVPSPVDGTVKELRAEAGELVKVGDVIITFEVDEAGATGGEAATDAAGSSEAVEPAEAGTEETAEAEETAGTDRTDGAAASGDGEAAPGGRVFAPPSARRLARELGVDIAAVEGSGPGGRVTENDVRAAAEGDAETTEPGAGGAEGESESKPRSAVRRVGGGDGEAEAATGGGGATAAAQAAAADRDRTLAAPATRQLARELGVDIDAVPAAEERDGEAFVTPEAVRAFAESEPAEAEAEAGGAPETAAEATDTGERVERVPYRGVRRTIGQQMERSAYTAPHVTHHDEVDVTALVETRTRLKERAAERGHSLTYLPFVMKAVVAALKEYPFLNAELDEEAEEILLKRYYDLGVATATDAGLMVPVVRDVDEKSMLELADDVAELVAKARDRSIAREEMQGGTFTITNFGAIGGEYATPIINYPEVAILGLGAIKEKPRVVDGEVVPRKVMTLSLSIDHRVVDGAVAAQFVNAVAEYLADPELLLLE